MTGSHKDRDTNSGRAADASVPKRKRGRPKGIPASEAQKATNVQARKKAAAARAARKAARQAELEKPRWKKLEDGDISVKDLTDEECIKGQVANNDGSWEGRRHQLPLRVVSRMEAESIRRARNDLLELVPAARDAIEARLDDDDAPAQQLAAARMVYEYRIGKVPDVVHIGAETEYDRLSQSAFVIMRGAEHVTVDDDGDDGKAGTTLVEEQG